MPGSSPCAIPTRRMPKRKPKSGAWTRSTPIISQVLEDKEVDVVELLTPHHLHCPMTVQAAQAGKHVSVQKPMALSAAEADQMIAAADKAGVTLRVYETFVYYAPAMRARATDRGRRDRRGPRRAHARQQRDRRHLLEGATLGLAVALQREAVRRRPAGLRPRLPPVLAGLLPGRTGREGLRLDRPDPGQGSRRDRQDRRAGDDHVPVQGARTATASWTSSTPPGCASTRTITPTTTASR